MWFFFVRVGSMCGVLLKICGGVSNCSSWNKNIVYKRLKSAQQCEISNRSFVHGPSALI